MVLGAGGVHVSSLSCLLPSRRLTQSRRALSVQARAQARSQARRADCVRLCADGRVQTKGARKVSA